MKTMNVVLLVLLITAFAVAQQRWTKTYGGSGNDGANSVQQTTDGSYILTASTNSFGMGGNDVYLVKTNTSGDTIWTRTYGGTGDDVGYSVRQTSDGGYIIIGFTLSFSASRDVYLIKTNASGDTQWTKTFGGSGNDIGYSAEQTADLGYILAGYTTSHGAGAQDVYLIKTNASGDTLWTRTYGGTGDDEGYSVRQTSDNGYIVAGLTNSPPASVQSLYLIKTNSSGDTLWTRTYAGGLEASGNSVRQTLDGGYIVGGYDYPSGATSYDIYPLKTNSVGDTLWTRTYNEAGIDYGSSARQTSDGGYIIAGWTYVNNGQRVTFADALAGYIIAGWTYVNNPSYATATLIKTNASGDTLWTRFYGGGGEQQVNCVERTSDGGYVAAGNTNSFGAGNFDVYLIKTDANGSAAVEEPARTRPEAAGSLEATPSPFVSFARIPGHETERFDLYDISGKLVGAYRGDRIGEGLAPAVYFIKLDAQRSMSLRIVKAR